MWNKKHLLFQHCRGILKTTLPQAAENCIWKQLTNSSSIGSFFFFWVQGGGDIHWRPVWCGVDGSPHKLRSSVLAGRDNYTALWNKGCAEAGGSYATVSSSHVSRQAKGAPMRPRTMADRYPAEGIGKITTTHSSTFWINQVTVWRVNKTN